MRQQQFVPHHCAAIVLSACCLLSTAPAVVAEFAQSDSGASVLSLQNPASEITKTLQVAKEPAPRSLSMSQFQQHLVTQEQYLRQQLSDRELSQREFNALRIAHTQVTSMRANLGASYRAYLKDLQQRFDNLRHIVGPEIPNSALQPLKAALGEADSNKAEKLLRQMLMIPKLPSRVAAELEFQLGKVAGDEIRYDDALGHFERAVKKQPNSLRYLGEAAYLAGTLGLHRQELRLERSALKIALQRYGKLSPEVAARHNNLGSAYQSLGKYSAAIKHNRLALDSGLKIYGENHPKVALRRNNLGMAYQNLGQHDKAITYFEKALLVFEASLGKSHPNTQVVADNLAQAQQALENSKLADSGN
ncbi:MAG: tetratricopeptide repeat protein [Cellvibrionaceae bacterium]|nr:tetratricopeptide repeat protein [Cellvibrionaceae bacterium]